MFLQHQIDIAIQRLQEFEPDEGYYLAFSGGKDSIVIKQLAIEAGVKFDVHYNDTTIDPPELRLFIKRNHADVEWHKPEVPFLTEIIKRGFPMRRARWCCDDYKEKGGENRIVVTGVRWSESSNRGKRRFIESCYKSKKEYLHPIIDWKDEDVWEYIRLRNIPYCKLYDEGFDRIGCIMCPLAKKSSRIRESKRYPNMTRGFIRAFNKLYEAKDPDVVKRWANGEEMFWWWLTGEGHEKEEETNQIMMFD